MADIAKLIPAFANAPTLDASPVVVNVLHTPPPNPPRDVQTRVTGASYEPVYQDAAKFVTAADGWSRQHGDGLGSHALDFGSGWGRICRFLLAHVPPSGVYALDVDPSMTALTQATLPGVQSLTVPSMPPTIFRDAFTDSVTSFSVFSHLSPAAHQAWALELGRLTRTGGMAFITVLDEAFFDEIRNAERWVAKGETSPFAVSLASLFPDVDQARRSFQRGELLFSGSGGGGVLTPDFYGWAAAPRQYVEEVWGRAGFEIVEWVPSGVLFAQAMVGLRKARPGSPS